MGFGRCSFFQGVFGRSPDTHWDSRAWHTVSAKELGSLSGGLPRNVLVAGHSLRLLQADSDVFLATGSDVPSP